MVSTYTYACPLCLALPSFAGRQSFAPHNGGSGNQKIGEGLPPPLSVLPPFPSKCPSSLPPFRPFKVSFLPVPLRFHPSFRPSLYSFLPSVPLSAPSFLL